MKLSYRAALTFAGASTWVLVAVSNAATIIPMESYNPATFFSGGITAGLDFDVSSPTQTGFLGIPASNNKTYNVTHNGITFDITVINANLANQSRDRNDDPPNHKGALVRDFEQWYGDGDPVAATFALSGLKAKTDYEISFFTFNANSGATTHRFYEGTSTNDPLITTFTTSGNQNDYETWSPGITFQINSGDAGEIAVTVQSVGQRVTMCGVAVVGPTTVIPIESFDPTTFFSAGITAGIDFDDSSPTEAGFLGIPASNNKTYNVTTGGITFDIVVSNADQVNQNRDRGVRDPVLGSLVRDFEQWYGTGDPVAAAFSLTELKTRTDYDISFFTYNYASGQSTDKFYEGASTNDRLMTTSTTSGGNGYYDTWSPGITFRINSGYNRQIDVTVQSVSERLTINGVSVVQGDSLPPEGTVLVFK